jgi:tRNA (cmo5U34)-methyltransferase
MQTDTGYAPPKWTFDSEVSRVFDDMLKRSIPQYDEMRSACYRVGCSFVTPKTAIVDIGCSQGEALAPFVEKYGAANKFFGLEVSKPMLAAARSRFSGMIDCGIVEICEHDLRNGIPNRGASLILSVLSLQFTPIEYRQRIVDSAFVSLIDGGALIVVEKILGANAFLNDLFVDAYHERKHDNGSTASECRLKACLFR